MIAPDAARFLLSAVRLWRGAQVRRNDKKLRNSVIFRPGTGTGVGTFRKILGLVPGYLSVFCDYLRGTITNVKAGRTQYFALSRMIDGYSSTAYFFRMDQDLKTCVDERRQEARNYGSFVH